MPHDALLKRIRAEYLEMPGLRLTREQAQRLWGVDAALCQLMLDALVDERFLCIRPNGSYARASDVADRLPLRVAKASLQVDKRPARAS